MENWKNQSQSYSPYYIDEIHQTLIELEKATANFSEALRSAEKAGLYDVIKQLKRAGGNSKGFNLQQMIKGIDLNQITAMLQSPMIKNMLSDPEFMALFSPDTGTTPGTQAEIYPHLNQQDTNQQAQARQQSQINQQNTFSPSQQQYRQR